jgi:hypothetical protein
LNPHEALDFVSQLPSTVRDELVLPASPDLNVTLESIVEEMAWRLGIDPGNAASMVQRVGSALGEFVSAGEIEHVKSQLPSEMKLILSGALHQAAKATDTDPPGVTPCLIKTRKSEHDGTRPRASRRPPRPANSYAKKSTTCAKASTGRGARSRRSRSGIEGEKGRRSAAAAGTGENVGRNARDCEAGVQPRPRRETAAGDVAAEESSESSEVEAGTAQDGIEEGAVETCAHGGTAAERK